MPKKRISSDPVAASVRLAKASRRIGIGSKCVCGEDRPLALIKGSDPVICANCQRQQQRKTTLDRHHVAGKNNHPATVDVPVNDHRAVLSDAQNEWPRKTRENPDGSPLLRAAGCVRGVIDTIKYFLDRVLYWVAGMLESLDEYLDGTLGKGWWINTPLNQFAPEPKSR